MKKLKFRNEKAKRYLEYLKADSNVQYVGYVYYRCFPNLIKILYNNGAEILYTRKEFIEKSERWCNE